MPNGAGTLAAALVLLAALSACTDFGSDTSAPSPEVSATAPGTDQSSSKATLVVQYADSYLPAGSHKVLVPSDIQNVADASRCRVWPTVPVNFGGAVGGEVHVLVPAAQVNKAAVALGRLRAVATVTVAGPEAFLRAPKQPPGTPPPTACKSA